MLAVRDRRLRLVVAAVPFVLLALGVVAGPGDDLLLAVPALALFVPLLLGRYPGEERIARLAAAVESRRRSARRPRGTAARRRRPRPLALVPRGGRLIAASLAVRPPPAPSVPA